MLVICLLCLLLTSKELEKEGKPLHCHKSGLGVSAVCVHWVSHHTEVHREIPEVLLVGLVAVAVNNHLEESHVIVEILLAQTLLELRYFICNEVCNLS